MHYLLHLNESEDDVSEEKGLENDSSVEIRDVNASSIDNRLNVKDNAARCWIIDDRVILLVRMLCICPDKTWLILKYLCSEKDLILFQLLIQ